MFTKFRRNVFNNEMLTCCAEITRKVCEDFEADMIELNGEGDHVHLLVHYPAKVALSHLVNSLKGVSSRRLRQEFTSNVNRAIMPAASGSGSYFVGSCGGGAQGLAQEPQGEGQQHPPDGDPPDGAHRQRISVTTPPSRPKDRASRQSASDDSCCQGDRWWGVGKARDRVERGCGPQAEQCPATRGRRRQAGVQALRYPAGRHGQPSWMQSGGRRRLGRSSARSLVQGLLPSGGGAG
ncbi:IS200/IS605 family transposase [Streptomyces sp. NPDC101149]|uniref:IS200/IS605 family transposase n=1 Tax=Streptomyces sp. NPDC101149 TaxID=3366113 RepID=UPI00380D76A6